jgi:hypothetical protein
MGGSLIRRDLLDVVRIIRLTSECDQKFAIGERAVIADQTEGDLPTDDIFRKPLQRQGGGGVSCPEDCEWVSLEVGFAGVTKEKGECGDEVRRDDHGCRAFCGISNVGRVGGN